MDERSAAAYRKLDEVVRELTAITEDESDQGEPRYTATDYVLIVGAQAIDNDGDRVGYITVYPQNGSQPSYITTGLVAQAEGFLAAATDPE